MKKNKVMIIVITKITILEQNLGENRFNIKHNALKVLLKTINRRLPTLLP